MHFITLSIYLSIFFSCFYIHKKFHYYLGNCKRQYVGLIIRIIIINSSPNSFLTVILLEIKIKYVYRLFEKAWSAGSSPDFSWITFRGQIIQIHLSFQIQAWRKSEQTWSQCSVWEEAVFTHNLELSDSVQSLNRWKVYQKHTGLYHLKENQCSFGSLEGLGVLRKNLRSSALRCPGTTAPLRRWVCCEVRGVWCCVKAWLTDSH